MKSMIFLLLIVLCTFEVKPNEDILDLSNYIYQIPNVYQIGYNQEKPVFRGYEDNYVYIFDGEFKVFSHGMNDYYPIYYNNNISIFSAQSKNINEIIICKNNNKKQVILPHKPSWLISSSYGDTLYYSAEFEQGQIYIYIVNEEKLFKGTKVNYEDFWIINDLFYYSLMNDDFETCFFVSNNAFNKGDTLFFNKNIITYSTISYDGKYLVGRPIRNTNKDYFCIINTQTQQIMREAVPSASYFPFFYNNKLYYYKSGDSDVIESSLEL